MPGPSRVPDVRKPPAKAAMPGPSQVPDVRKPPAKAAMPGPSRVPDVSKAASAESKKRKAHRTERDCPIQNCKNKKLINTSHHLKVQHGIRDSDVRKHWCSVAKHVSVSWLR